jgi:muramoyltetrapeptide carboxypeptidase LdcA involved in peptidoglycan recycling
MIEKGVFANAAGVVICDFNSKRPKQETEEKLKKFAERIPCPVYSGFPYGHISNTSIIDFRRPLTITPDGTLSWKK